MKKSLTALIVCVYLAPAATLFIFFLLGRFSGFADEVSSIASRIIASSAAILLAFALLLLYLALSIANTVLAIYAAKKAETLPFRTILKLKLCMIPAYPLSLYCNFLLVMSIMGPWGMMFFPFVLACPWCILAGISAHSIARLFVLREKGIITAAQFRSHRLAQLTFVWDLADSLRLPGLEKKWFASTPSSALAAECDVPLDPAPQIW